MKNLVVEKLKMINNSKNDELARIELYAVITHIILSKDFFSNNSDISSLLGKFNIEAKPYLLKSRTTMLGRFLRKIQRADSFELKVFVDALYNLQKDLEMANNQIEKESEAIDAQTKDDSIETKKTKEQNYMDGILKKYSRTGRQQK